MDIKRLMIQLVTGEILILKNSDSALAIDTTYCADDGTSRYSVEFFDTLTVEWGSFGDALDAAIARAEAAERELAELRAANEWRPVTEKPERWSWRGGFIVATEAEEVYYVDEYDKGTWWRGDGYMKECKFVTHWRRLPPPPNIIQE